MPPAFEVRFPGTLGAFEQAFTRLRRTLDALPLEAAARYNVELVFEELVANIVRHAARGGPAAEVRVRLELGPESISLIFEDDGVAFDPRQHPDLPPPKSLDDAGSRGFGLLLVRRAASSLDYRRTPEGRNRFTVTVSRHGAVQA